MTPARLGGWFDDRSPRGDWTSGRGRRRLRRAAQPLVFGAAMPTREGTVARCRDGVPNPNAWCFAGWIDVPNARRDLFVKSLQARYAAKASVHGALVDRDGYSALQPLDALWVLRVSFAIELPIGPSPGGRADWVPKVSWWPEVEDHVAVSTAVTRHGDQRATAAVSFALGHKPSESVLIGDLAVYWAPVGK